MLSGEPILICFLSQTYTADEHLQKSKMEIYSVLQCYKHYHPELYLRDTTLMERNEKVFCTLRDGNLPGVCNVNIAICYNCQIS